MKAFKNLPPQIALLNSGQFWCWMKLVVALELVRAKRAKQCYDAAGEFIGIEIGKAGPQPSFDTAGPWPPAELPGVKFQDPNIGRNYHRLVMRLSDADPGWQCAAVR